MSPGRRPPRRPPRPRASSLLALALLAVVALSQVRIGEDAGDDKEANADDGDGVEK